MHFVRDIAFGSDMRFARWKLQGEYNITVSKANNITFAKQKYHADEVSISLKRFTTHNFCDIHAFGVIWREVLAISPILCYNKRRKAVGT